MCSRPRRGRQRGMAAKSPPKEPARGKAFRGGPIGRIDPRRQLPGAVLALVPSTQIASNAKRIFRPARATTAPKRIAHSLAERPSAARKAPPAETPASPRVRRRDPANRPRRDFHQPGGSRRDAPCRKPCLPDLPTQRKPPRPCQDSRQIGKTATGSQGTTGASSQPPQGRGASCCLKYVATSRLASASSLGRIPQKGPPKTLHN